MKSKLKPSANALRFTALLIMMAIVTLLMIAIEYSSRLTLSASRLFAYGVIGSAITLLMALLIWTLIPNDRNDRNDPNDD